MGVFDQLFDRFNYDSRRLPPKTIDRVLGAGADLVDTEAPFPDDPNIPERPTQPTYKGPKPLSAWQKALGIALGAAAGPEGAGEVAANMVHRPEARAQQQYGQDMDTYGRQLSAYEKAIGERQDEQRFNRTMDLHNRQLEEERGYHADLTAGREAETTRKAEADQLRNEIAQLNAEIRAAQGQQRNELQQIQMELKAKLDEISIGLRERDVRTREQAVDLRGQQPEPGAVTPAMQARSQQIAVARKAEKYRKAEEAFRAGEITEEELVRAKNTIEEEWDNELEAVGITSRRHRYDPPRSKAAPASAGATIPPNPWRPGGM